jgi:drug/metabolite transporter (DMT)-like permease
MVLDFGFAVVSSVLLAFGLLMMKSKAAALPLAQGSGTARAVLAWLKEPMWIGGLAVQALGYGLFIAAVSGAPVSMVAVMMQGGIALFVLFSVVILGERARPREWLGIATVVGAIAMLSMSLSGGAAEGPINAPSLTIFSVVAIAIALGPIVAKRLAGSGTAQAAASGIAFGLAALYTKAMTDAFIADPHAALASRIAADPYVYAAIVANIVGIVMLQNSFHELRGMIAMPLSSALSNVVPIVGGMIVFGERLPAAPEARALRLGAFLLTVAAAAMLAASQEGASPAPASLKAHKA